MDRPDATRARLVASLLALTTFACSSAEQSARSLVEVDDRMTAVEALIASSEGTQRVQLCVEYVDLCERALALCLDGNNATTFSELCNPLSQRCQQTATRYCSERPNDDGGTAVPDAGTAVPDAGTTVPDAGATLPDAHVARADTEPPTRADATKDGAALTPTVTSASELKAALAAAKGGETIVLASGDYGVLHIVARSFSQYVTLRAAVPRGATFKDVEIEKSTYIRLDGIVAYGGRESVLISASNHIELLNSELAGANQYDRANPDYRQVSQFYGLQVKDGSTNVRIENNTAHDVQSSCYTFFGVQHLVVRGNVCEWTASDGFKFGGVDHALVENNSGMRYVYSSPTAHVDFMQIQGSPISDVTFRGNVALMNSRSFQGIFGKGNILNKNVLLENNVIYSGHLRGISIAGTNVVARNNTVLAATDGQGHYVVHKAVLIVDVSTKENNVVGTYRSAAGTSGGDHALQYEDAKSPFHYDDYYRNASKGVGLTIEDLRPVPGSPAADRVGAYARIAELTTR